MENQAIFVVKGFYDMNIVTDEEILIETYATEELAKQRCKQLIDTYKDKFKDQPCFCDCWDEDEYRLYAYMDSEWNVDISYDVEILRTKLEKEG